MGVNCAAETGGIVAVKNNNPAKQGSSFFFTNRIAFFI